jgi:energy-coupling factor transport system ATP-binding protein
MHDNVNLLIFDEPLAALDPKMGMIAVDLIDRIHAEQKKTIIIIEHRLEDVLYRPLDRVVLMDRGRIVFNDSPDKLLASDYLTRYGIREPLYIKAMKYAGCELEEGQFLSDIATMDLTPFREKLNQKQAMEIERYYPKLGEELLRVENVCFSYGEEEVLHDISFSVRQGERLAFVGKNGAGKSTMAKLICGIKRPTKGNILDRKSVV